MTDPQTNFITWQLLAVALLTVLQGVVGLIAVWAIKLLLAVSRSLQETTNRVSHIEGHLEMSDRGGVPFRRLEVDA